MPMHNLLKYSDNSSMESRNLWNYDRDKIDDDNDNASNSESFKFKVKIIGKTNARSSQS